MEKNYSLGRFVSIWFNAGQDGKRGWYSFLMKRTYKDRYGSEVEQKMSMPLSDAIILYAELGKAIQVAMRPVELVRREDSNSMPTSPGSTPQPEHIEPGDDIPF